VATKNNNRPEERSRVRFMLVAFDGSSSDLQQLASTFASAVRSQQPIVTALPAPAMPNVPALANATPQVVSQNGHQANVVAEEIQTIVHPEGAGDSPTKPPSGTKRKFRTPSIISTLDFTSGRKSLKTYIDEQAPEEHSKRYLAIVQWLKEHRNIGEVGADHIYTCYRALGLTVPDDVLGVLRAIKKQGWVEKGAVSGTYKITHVGEGQLKHTATA
jgi:hypothetical protein